MTKVQKLVSSGLCLGLCLVLPLLTGQIQQIGNMLLPMHIPVLLCGFLCGPLWGALVGLVAPLLRYIIFGMPVIFPMGISMAFELGTYGLVSGLLYGLLPKKNRYLYVSLISAMVAGRLVWGFVRYVLAGLTDSQFPFSVFIAGALTEAIPGILIQLIFIPIILIAMKKSKLMTV